MTIYEQIEKQALPLVEHYHADITTHDRAWLADHPDMPFLHLTRCTGTHLLPMAPADDPDWPAPGNDAPYYFGRASRENMLRGQLPALDAMLDANTLLALHYDGQTLKEIQPGDAKEILRDYVRRIKHEWAALAAV